MSDLFAPHSPGPESVDPRQAAIAELSRFVATFEADAAKAHTHAVIVTLRSCATQIERRIDGLRRGDPLAF